jgi:hypothetical protein
MKTGHLAIMQPYLFPYLGYFHLIEACELFIFYDDVHFIKRGWINRNRIALEKKEHLFTFPVKHASQNVLIKDTKISFESNWKRKFFSKLRLAYKDAPNFKSTMDLIEETLKTHEGESISDLAIRSIQLVYEYLGTDLKYGISSDLSPHTTHLRKSERLIQITKELGFGSYVNLPGGREIYTKEHFRNYGIDLHFINSLEYQYPQYNSDFIPSLSIIDVLMFNNEEETKDLLRNFTLI